MKIFTGFISLFKPRKEMTAYEIYLGQAKDIYDLEHRENAWKRGKRL